MTPLGMLETKRAFPLIRRLKALETAAAEARPLGFTDECEDLLPALIGFAMRNPEIEGCLCSAYDQRPFDYGRGRRRNRAMERSLESVGGYLDEHLVLLPSRYRLTAAISVLRNGEDDLPLRGAAQEGWDEWLEDWLLVNPERLLWDLESAFAMADLEQSAVAGGAS